jgi:hypothetical protein
MASSVTIKEARARLSRSIQNGEHLQEAGYPAPNSLNENSELMIQAMKSE